LTDDDPDPRAINDVIAPLVRGELAALWEQHAPAGHARGG
jgi:hypothetical protein